MQSATMHPEAVPAAKDGLSLLFAPGTRPNADTLAALFAGDAADGPSALILRSTRDGDALELLANGLTFDVSGLNVSAPLPISLPVHRYGFDEDAPIAADLERITLTPGEHIRAGGALLPVVKAMTSLAANLTLALPSQAVCWHPARCWMEPGYFARMTLNWIAGGIFPAPGLIGLNEGQGGAVRSDGLAHFIGQEIHLESHPNESATDAWRLAARAIDFLVGHGPVAEPLRIPLSGDALLAEPSKFAGQVWIWRDR